MPIEINLLREPARGGEPDRWREMTRKRNKPVALVDRAIELDEAWRKAAFETDNARKELGVVQRALGAKMKAKEPAEEEKAAKDAVEARVAQLEKAAEALLAARDKALSEVPNELDPSVPVSNDEADNAIVRTHGELRPAAPELMHHHELLAMIDGYEPGASARAAACRRAPRPAGGRGASLLRGARRSL